MDQPSHSLSPADRDQWARAPGTREFVQQLQDTVRLTKDRWAMGHFEGATAEETARLNTTALAGLDILHQVIDAVEDWKIVPVIEEPDNDNDD